MKEEKKKSYKDFRFPHVLLWIPIITTILGVIGVDWIGNFFVTHSNLNKISQVIFNTIVIVLVFAAIEFVSYWIIRITVDKVQFRSPKRISKDIEMGRENIFRGRGIWIILLLGMVFLPLIYIGFLFVLKNIIGINMHFCYKTIILFDFLVIVANCWILRSEMGFGYCRNCGLFNTMRGEGTSTRNLGVESRSHTTGGYYRDVNTSGSISTHNSYYNVNLTTQQYVPKTQVFDGVYSKSRKYYYSRCSVCGSSHVDSYDTETRIF